VRKSLFIYIFLLLVSTLFSSDISLDSYVDRTKIGIQDQVRFTLEFTGPKVSNIRTPSVKNLTGFRNMGSSSNTSSSVTVVNGKMEKTVVKSFTYNLKPTKIGNLLIPPLSIEVQNQKFTTKPIRISVSKESQGNKSNNNNRTSNEENISQKLADNLFIVADVNKSNVYKDEPVIVEYKFYTRYDISNLSFANEPNFNGFWKENISTADRISFERETYRNVSYNVMLMRSLALFPSKTGKLKIPSLEVNVDIRTKSNSFFDFGSTKRYEVKSKPVNITVKELPTLNLPKDFSGAVGNYTLKSSISETEIKVGDSFTYTLEIIGSGNLNNFEAPHLPDIQNLRFIDPEISTDINSNQVSGKKVIKYLVIAQEKGIYKIPALTFSYFDTNSKRYLSHKTKPYTLNISEGDQTYIPSSSAQSLVTREGSDIGFIIRETDLSIHTPYFNSFFYWCIIIMALLALPGFSFYYGKREKLYSDQDFLRKKQADKILKKYLKQATEKFKKGDENFYSDVQTGLSNYLADKLRINRGSSTGNILESLHQKVPDELLKQIQTLFSKCDQVRFMPGGFSENNINNDYELLKKTISELSRIKF